MINYPNKMHRSNRDESCKRALRESILSNGHEIISLENTTHNKRTKVQMYDILFSGEIDHSKIREEFDTDFEEYQLNPGRSYVKITSIRPIRKPETKTNTLCTVVVKYCNDYRPYSSDLSFRQLINKNEELIKTIESLKSAYRELYLSISKQEECPVCYCCLQYDNIELPICAHAICAKCYVKCEKCPLCRKEYLR